MRPMGQGIHGRRFIKKRPPRDNPREPNLDPTVEILWGYLFLVFHIWSGLGSFHRR
jgi:hypothetical protein